eukprot:gb/GECG01001151.1/.p1 GENE.gb/GECG01001151.1/~~gb/GECG01001151.1/.p1  ORF type:complete len:304 (+),score=50.14 gb/GECG01001151.1/:1-912(+)
MEKPMSTTPETPNSSSETSYSATPWSSTGTLNANVRTGTPFPGVKQQRPFGTSVGYNFGASPVQTSGTQGLGRQIRGRPKALGSLFGRASSSPEPESSSGAPAQVKSSSPTAAVCVTACAEAETEMTSQCQPEESQTENGENVGSENESPEQNRNNTVFKTSRQLLGKSAGLIVPRLAEDSGGFAGAGPASEPTVKRSRISKALENDKTDEDSEAEHHELLAPRDHEFQLQNLREEASNLKEKYKEASERFTGELNSLLEGIKRSIQAHVETLTQELEEEDSQNKQILFRSKQIDKVSHFAMT